MTVLVFAFAGQMRACLMVKSEGAVIRNVDDLARRTSVKPYTLSGSILTTLLRVSAHNSHTHSITNSAVENVEGQTDFQEFVLPGLRGSTFCT